MNPLPEWRGVVGWEDLYEVSSDGRVRSLPREVVHGRGHRYFREGRELKLVLKKGTGYIQVSLCRQGKQFDRLVHILVAEAFHGPKMPGMEVLHLNAERSDNRASNLRWGTRQENQIQKVQDGNHTKAARTECPRGHLLQLPNLCAGALRSGHRSCLACSRARSRTRYRPDLASQFKAISDDCYRAIMEAVA